MLTSNKIIENNCDNNTTSIKLKSLTADSINMSIINEKTTQTTRSAATTNHFDYDKTINRRPLEADSFVCDFSLKRYCGEGERAYKKSECIREQDNGDNDDDDDHDHEEDIYFDSANESEDYEGEYIKVKRNKNEIKIAENFEEVDCGLSKLYLSDREIISSEGDAAKQTMKELLNVTEQKSQMQQSKRNLRVALGIVLRLIFPLTNGVVQSIKGIKDVQFLKVIRGIASSRMILTDLFAYAANTISLNLSSVQVVHRIEPLLKLLKIRIAGDGSESLPDTLNKPYGGETFPNLATDAISPVSQEPRYSLPTFQFSGKKFLMEECEAKKCCTLNILAEPPTGQNIRADIVFIHGLNGSLANTWKQGLWENERRPVEFQRPPKPPVRPPKRPRHSRTSIVQPAHHKKRARFSHADACQKFSHERDSNDEAEEDNFSFMSSESKDLPAYDGLEDSYPTYRLRLHDNGRLLKAEHDSKLQNANNQQSKKQAPEDTTNMNNFNKTPLKPSPNDPNYSKCWPGDWLPIDCPGVRVIALNYTSDQHLWRPVWKKKEARSNLIQRSREMIELLIKHRVGYGHPIVWVGHSKGGLFIKQIIVDAWESGRPAAAPFWRSSRGVFFYSVPHRGSHLASIRAPFLIRSVELTDVEKNNKYLLDLHRRFAGLYHLGHLKIEVFSFVETALTLMSVLYMRIVGVDSGDPGIGDVCGIRLDHREICKPRSRDCILYKQLVNMINKVS